MEGVFKSDMSGDASLDIVKSACRFAKKNINNTRMEMLATFLTLKIKVKYSPEKEFVNDTNTGVF